MNNYNQLDLYLVTNGKVTPADADTDWDGIDSVLVAATSEDAALRVADAYALSQVGPDNLVWGGESIAAVTLRDRETGLYA